MQHQCGLTEDWRPKAVEALGDKWDDMRRRDGEERARILELLEEKLGREEEEYKEMEKQVRQRREEERRRWDDLRRELKQLELEEQRALEAEQERKAEELRQKEAEQHKKDEELWRKEEELWSKEEEQRRKIKELRRRDLELRRQDEELRKMDEERRRKVTEQPKMNQEREGQHIELTTVQSTVDDRSSLPGSLRRLPGERERPSSSRSRIPQPISMDTVFRSSSAIGITQQGSFVRPHGRHAPHSPSASHYSGTPREPARAVRYTGGGRTSYRVHAQEGTQKEASRCCSIM